MVPPSVQTARVTELVKWPINHPAPCTTRKPLHPHPSIHIYHRSSLHRYFLSMLYILCYVIPCTLFIIMLLINETDTGTGTRFNWYLSLQVRFIAVALYTVCNLVDSVCYSHHLPPYFLPSVFRSPHDEFPPIHLRPPNVWFNSILRSWYFIFEVRLYLHDIFLSYAMLCDYYVCISSCFIVILFFPLWLVWCVI